jgi:hypothetical protein
MPFQTVWVPLEKPPKVVKKLPDGAEVEGRCEAHLGDKEWHKCSMCKGWVEGRAGQRREDSMGILCGRRGRVTYCQRCGHEIGFFGMVS